MAGKWDHKSRYSDGKNAVSHRYQPSVFFQTLYNTEKEVLEAYGKKTYAEFFRQPDMRRSLYFPLWTAKVVTGSDEDIAKQKILEVRRKYTPLLIMAEAGKYDEVWNEYIAEIYKIPHRDKHAQFYQDVCDERVRKSGGY